MAVVFFFLGYFIFLQEYGCSPVLCSNVSESFPLLSYHKVNKMACSRWTACCSWMSFDYFHGFTTTVFNPSWLNESDLVDFCPRKSGDESWEEIFPSRTDSHSIVPIFIIKWLGIMSGEDRTQILSWKSCTIVCILFLAAALHGLAPLSARRFVPLWTPHSTKFTSLQEVSQSWAIEMLGANHDGMYRLIGGISSQKPDVN